MTISRSKVHWLRLFVVVVVVVVGSATTSTVSAFTIGNKRGTVVSQNSSSSNNNNNKHILGRLPPSLVVSSNNRLGSVNSSPRTTTSSTTTTTTSTQLWAVPPQGLATEGDWTAYLDQDATGLIYYFNRVTGESRWEAPTNTFPMVSLPEDLRRKAEVKRLAYIRQVQEKERERLAAEQQQQQQKGTTTTTTQTTKQEKAGEKWFDFLFEDVETKQVEQEQPVAEQVPVQEETVPAGGGQEEPNWFANIFKAAADTATEAVETIKKEEEDDNDEQVGATPAAVTKQQEEKIQVVEPQVAPIKLEMATCVLPHPQKVFWGGEDAVFTAGRTFGVFDGVSGARKLDGIPLYSKTLASEMKKKCREERGLSVQDMQKYLQQARETADETSTGASTALVASITEDGFLRALNVGDSTCIVVRDGRIVSRTREISHFFECPYQLSVDSPDRPRDGTKMNLELVRGDLIIMGSDGVFDNLSDQEILQSLEQADTAKLGRVAKRLADRSRKVSLNKNAETPYAKLAKKNGDPDYENGLGGKVDDVSCVVVRYA